MNHHVHHHGKSPRCNRLLSSFSHTILEVSPDTTEGDRLVLHFQVLKKLRFTKWGVVCSITLNLNSKLISITLEGVLPLQCLAYSS